MSHILFPFFLARLIIANALWGTQFGVFLLGSIASFWCVSFTSVLCVLTFLMYASTPFTQAKLLFLHTPSPTLLFNTLSSYAQEDFYQASTLLNTVPTEQLPIPLPPLPHNTNTASLLSEKQFWLDLLQLQPTHRDILLNLATISITLGETDDAKNYRRQADEVDPNYFENIDLRFF